MRFSSAQQAICDSYRGMYRRDQDFTAVGENLGPLQPRCPHCRGLDIPRRLDADQQRVRNYCTRCQVFVRPVKARSPTTIIRSSNEGVADNDYRICNALEGAKVRSVVEGLPPVQSLWLRYAYADSLRCDEDAESVVIEWLQVQLATCPPMELDFAIVGKVMHLLLVLIYESRGLARKSAGQRTDSEFALVVFGDSKYRCNFKKGLPWRRLVDSARWHLMRLDGEALEPVQALLDDLARKQRAA